MEADAQHKIKPLTGGVDGVFFAEVEEKYKRKSCHDYKQEGIGNMNPYAHVQEVLESRQCV